MVAQAFLNTCMQRQPFSFPVVLSVWALQWGKGTQGQDLSVFCTLLWCWGGVKMGVFAGFPPASSLYSSWQASQHPVMWNAQAGEQTFVVSGLHSGGILVLLLNCGHSLTVKCKDWSHSKIQRNPLEYKNYFEKPVCVISHLLLLLKIAIVNDSKLNAGWISYFNVVVCKVLS